jgi:hypothetical protein
MSDERSLSPEAERAIAGVRRLMMIASVTTFVAVAAVLIVIGYRVFHLGGSAPPPPPPPGLNATLPAGAKVLSSAVGEGRIVLTVEVGGAIELYSFDLNTLKPLGRVRLERKP